MVQRLAVEYWPPGLPGMEIVRTVDDLRRMERYLVGAKRLVFDLETSGIAWHAQARAVGAAFATWIGGQVRCWYLPFRHSTGEPQVPVEYATQSVRYLLAQAQQVIAHHIKFDAHFSVKEGWAFPENRYDTMIASALYNENVALRLESRAERHLGVEDPLVWNRRVQGEIAVLAKQVQLKKTEYLGRFGYSQVPINLLGIYACHDVLYTAGLYDFFEGRHSVSRTYERVWRTEMELTRILGDMERYGLLVDVEYLEGLRVRLQEVCGGLRGQIAVEFGKAFNPGSDVEVAWMLYDRYKLGVIKRTKGGGPSVDSEVLGFYKTRIPGLGLLLEWRDADKLLNTYTTSILKRLDGNNVCHPDFQQVGTLTGRMACKEPNFQNMPTDSTKRKKENNGIDAWSIRRAFIVCNRNGKPVPRLFLDYSQVELRMLAFYTRDPIMVDVYLNDGDIHARTQQEVGLVLGTEIERRKAKIVNFGLSYCLTDLGLSRQSGMSVDDARRFMAAFNQRYAGIAAFRKYFWNQVRAQRGHWFSNLFGRRRRLPLLSSSNKGERGRAERQAIGSLIQGQAAELTKESLVRLDFCIRRLGLPVNLCNVVHDDIQMDCAPEALVDVCRIAKTEMERYPEFAPIPIRVDGDYSVTSWSNKKPLPL